MKLLHGISTITIVFWSQLSLQNQRNLELEVEEKESAHIDSRRVELQIAGFQSFCDLFIRKYGESAANRFNFYKRCIALRIVKIMSHKQSKKLIK